MQQDQQAYGPQLPISEETHARKHRLAGETFREAMSRIAGALADDPTHFYQYRDILLNQRFLPAGRVQSAVGSPRRVTAFNCYVSRTIEDSMDGIMEAAHEAANTMRLGGGIGYDFSSIRPRHDTIVSLDSKSSGPISFMQIFDSVCKTIASAGQRRGAQMGVLRVDHPDIEEFIEAKCNATNLTQFNISVGVTDKFMRAVERGTDFELQFNGRTYKRVDARLLWDKLMRATWDWAEPGILFIDRINEMNNLWYCETIAATNPCFTGDTRVWTEEGPVRFDELAETGNDVRVLTQDDAGLLQYQTMRRPRVTGRNAKLVKVTLDDGTAIRCTPSHKFFTRRGEVEAQHLQEDDSVRSVYRYRANQKGYVRVCNGTDSAPLEHHVPFAHIPDGHHVHHKNGITSDNRASNLEIMDGAEHNAMHMRGDSNPMRRFPEKNHFHTLDTSGENNGRYRDDVKDDVLTELRKSGLSYAAIAHQVGCAKHTVMKRLGWNHKVVSVEMLEEIEDVYCGTVDETHRFFVVCDEGAVLVRNCGEQPLPPYGACLLGSFNLVKYLMDIDGKYRFNWEAFIADIPAAVAAQDNIIDRTVYPLKQQKREAEMKRRMGLGYTGLANAGEALGYTYGSPEFLKFQRKVSKVMTNEAYRASAMLAARKGSFPLFDKDKYMQSGFIQKLDDDVRALIAEYGIRNSHLISIAPTGTISLTADNVSSGCEPVFSHFYDRTIIDDNGGSKVERVSDYGYRELGVRGKTADECTVDEHLAVFIVASEWVDSAVSKTLNVGEDVSWEDFKSIYMRAWKAKCKGCTTFRAAGKRYGVLNKVEPDATACYVDLATGKKTCD